MSVLLQRGAGHGGTPGSRARHRLMQLAMGAADGFLLMHVRRYQDRPESVSITRAGKRLPARARFLQQRSDPSASLLNTQKSTIKRRNLGGGPRKHGSFYGLDEQNSCFQHEDPMAQNISTAGIPLSPGSKSSTYYGALNFNLVSITTH